MSKKRSNSVYEWDVEIFPNYFEVGIKDYRTKKVLNLEVSEEFDQREEIYEFFKNYSGYLVSFNGLHYDCLVVKFLLKDWKKLSPLCWKDFCKQVKEHSDKVINQEENWEYIKQYLYQETTWIDIDLFCYWSKMLRVSKKISLKSLGIQLEYPVLQELPYHNTTVLTLEQVRIVRKYNNVHDLGILDLLCERMKDEIKLRMSIQKDYSLNCLSWDAIKIASEALLQDYCKKTDKELRQIRNLHFTQSNTPVSSVLKGFDPKFKLPLFQKLFSETLNLYSDDLKSHPYYQNDFLVIHGNTSIRISYGAGGIHSVNENELYESTKTHKILTSDFASLYPNLIINYKCIRFEEVLKQYEFIKKERLVAKKAGEKLKDTFFKLILNGISGLLDNTYSWLYFPEGALRMRLIGQFILTKTMEVCLLNNWQVLSINTDGIEAIVPIEEIDKYKQEMSQIEKQFNLEFEHEGYNKIVYTNVNNYICQKESGKLKKKGLYKTKEEIPLGDSINELVIPKALQEYFINKVPVEEVIVFPERWGLGINDYCCANKISKEYDVYYDGNKVQNLNKYYFSKPAPFLFKKKKTKKNANFERVNAGDPVLLFNEFIKKPIEEYKINYTHYIHKAKEIINAIEIKKQQLSLF